MYLPRFKVYSVIDCAKTNFSDRIFLVVFGVSAKSLGNALSTFTNIHNSGLSATENFLSQKLSPEINLIPLDVNSLFNRIIAAPSKFDLTNVTNSCLSRDLSVVPIAVSTQPIACIPDKFLFWDEVHPTTAVHKLIGELAFSALKPVSVPEPSTALGVLAFGVLYCKVLIEIVLGERKSIIKTTNLTLKQTDAETLDVKLSER